MRTRSYFHQATKDGEERHRCLDVPAEVVERYNGICHADCPMTHHYDRLRGMRRCEN